MFLSPLFLTILKHDSDLSSVCLWSYIHLQQAWCILQIGVHLVVILVDIGYPLLSTGLLHSKMSISGARQMEFNYTAISLFRQVITFILYSVVDGRWNPRLNFRLRQEYLIHVTVEWTCLARLGKTRRAQKNPS